MQKKFEKHNQAFEKEYEKVFFTNENLLSGVDGSKVRKNFFNLYKNKIK